MNAKKSLVAASLTAALLAAGAAQAGTLTINNASGKNTNFATEIWGAPSGPTSMSASQEFYAPDLVYIPAVNIAAGTEIRFNLLAGSIDGSAAQFAQNITKQHLIAFVGDNLVAQGAADAELVGGEIVSGGAAGQSFVTVRFASIIPAGSLVVLRLTGDINGVTYGGFSVAQINDVAANDAVDATTGTAPQIFLKNGNILGTTDESGVIQASVSIQGGIDATPAKDIAYSQYGVDLITTTESANNGSAPNFTINSATGDVLFSGLADGPSVTSFTTTRTYNHIGTVRWVLADAYQANYEGLDEIDTAIDGVTGIVTTLGDSLDQIADPAGKAYAPDGADSVTLEVYPTTAGTFLPFSAGGGKVFLESGGSCGATQTGGLTGAVNADKAVFSVTNNLGTTYQVCVVANGSDAITPTSIRAALVYNNAEPSFQDPALVRSLSSLARNGCTVDLPNIAASNNAQEATFIRLINKSASVTGPVRLTIWNQDGSLAGTRYKKIKDSVKAHETAVWSVKELEDAAGVGPWAGRARISFLGGFDTCDAMGLQRTITSGELKNFSDSSKQDQNGN